MILQAIATVCTYPIQLAQSRLRAMKSQSKDKAHVQYQYKGTFDVLLKGWNAFSNFFVWLFLLFFFFFQVLQNDGPLGLFRGMEAKLYQVNEIDDQSLNCSDISFAF